MTFMQLYRSCLNVTSDFSFTFYLFDHGDVDVFNFDSYFDFLDSPSFKLFSRLNLSTFDLDTPSHLFVSYYLN